MDMRGTGNRRSTSAIFGIPAGLGACFHDRVGYRYRGAGIPLGFFGEESDHGRINSIMNFSPRFLAAGMGGVALIGAATFFTVRGGGPAETAYQTEHKPREERTVHLKTPEPVRAIYMPSFVAGDKTWREKLVNFVASNEVNSIVIDMKDYTGRVSFETQSSYVQSVGSSRNLIPDIRDFLQELHSKGVYAIARIAVFQDPYFVAHHPEVAVKTKEGAVWRDRKGIPWVDPSDKEYWNYTVALALEAERAGFDEVNFDYIRFPSDGNMIDIAYENAGTSTTHAEVIRDFFAYLRKNLDDGFSRPRAETSDLTYVPTPIPLSVDLFGMTTVNTDDLNIGQVLENAMPYFDYVAPMVYPSHYPPTYKGFENPADHPYEIIRDAMAVASRRFIAASSTPAKLRPWLQDFNLGAVYDAAMVRKEMQAVYDSGLTSWMSWDAANRYTPGAYLPQ